MNNRLCQLLALLILVQSTAFSQRLKKADRQIASNIQTHLSALSAKDVEREYISKQFARWGLKPKGDTNTWYQQFDIYDGKDILPETRLAVNNKQLKILEDYFPFTFSGNKSVEVAVSIALAEKGVPWFKDLKELMEGMEDSTHVDTLSLIRTKAIHAAEKGASALIIYNSDGPDLTFNKYYRSAQVEIPIIYIRKQAFKKCCSDESAVIDIALNVATKENIRKGNNVIGYADNNADSTIITAAHLDRETDVAALLELARLQKNIQKKRKNYLFIAYSSERNGEAGTAYFKDHPSVDLQKVNYSFDLDTVTVPNENPKGLFLVKRSIEIIKSN